jgi:AraC-like DNA-binding protein
MTVWSHGKPHITGLPPGGGGWLSALAGPQLGAALRLIHEHPGTPWTLALLAARTGRSGSAFAARFTRLVGRAPVQYLTYGRMQRARRLLRAGSAGIAQIAAQLGLPGRASIQPGVRALGRHRTRRLPPRQIASASPGSTQGPAAARIPSEPMRATTPWKNLTIGDRVRRRGLVDEARRPPFAAARCATRASMLAGESARASKMPSSPGDGIQSPRWATRNQRLSRGRRGCRGCGGRARV